MSAFTLPNIQRCTPVTVTADSPVLNILKPVSETSFSNTFRNPVDRVVICDQVIFYSRHFDEPGLTCVVDQRSITSPAVRIAVLKFRSVKEKPSLIQIFEYHRIRFLHEYSCKWSLCSHISFFVYQLYKWKFIISSDIRIVFTKCRRNVNHSCTICQCYIIIACHIKCFFVLFLCIVSCTLVQWLILFVFQIFSYICLQNLISRCSFFCKLSKNRIKKRLCHVIYITVCCFYFYISLTWIYTKRQV